MQIKNNQSDSVPDYTKFVLDPAWWDRNNPLLARAGQLIFFTFSFRKLKGNLKFEKKKMKKRGRR